MAEPSQNQQPEDDVKKVIKDVGQRTGVIGHTLGGCKVISKLGEGGMAAVFKAHDPGLDREVAIKILPPSLAREETYRERFLREARVLARVKHQNLVQVYSVAAEKGVHFFSMEYIEGESLQQRIRHAGPMLLEQMLSVSGQVLSALSAVHSEGITHRDIKSSNIMIDRAGRAILMDLGLAKDKDSTGVTTAGVIIGTPEFMSPEQAMGEAVGPQSDIYSFGIVLYEMCTGVVPFRGKSAVAVLRQHCESQPEPLGKARPDLPREFIEAIEAATGKRPNERPQGVAGMAERLLRAGSSPELVALVSSSAASANPLSQTPTVVDRSMHTAPTMAGSPVGTALQQTEAPSKPVPFYKRRRVQIIAAIVFVILLGLMRGAEKAEKQNNRGKSPAEEPAKHPVAASKRPVVEIYVGGENHFPGRTATLMKDGITPTHIHVMLDDGTVKKIPLSAYPELRYKTQEPKPSGSRP